MAQKADGTIYVNTAIETDGFTSGGKEVEAAARRMAKSVSNIGTSAKIALQKQTDAFIKQNQNYEQQFSKLEALKEKFKELSETKIATKEFADLNKEISKLEAELDKAVEKQIKFLEIGGDKKSRTFKGMEYDIERISQKLDEARAKKEQLETSGKAYTAPDTSALEQKIAAEEIKTAQMKTALGTAYEALKAKIEGYGGYLSQSADDTADSLESEGDAAKSAAGNMSNLERAKSRAANANMILGKESDSTGRKIDSEGKQVSLLNAVLNGLKLAANGARDTIKAVGKAILSIPSKTIELVKNGVVKLSKAALSGAKAITKLVLGIAGFKKHNKSMGDSFGGGLKNILKYSLGIRSLFVLFNRLRSAAVEGFKNLAQYDNQTNASISSLMSALTQLKNSFATAFAPVLNVAAPILTTFINMISKAVTYVGMFIAALTGQKNFTKAIGVQQNYANSLNNTAGAAENAAEAQDDYLSGLDEVNRFQTKDSGSGTGSGAGSGAGGSVLPSDMFETVSIGDKFSDLAEKIKEAWKNADFTEIGEMVAEKLNSALEKIPWTKIRQTASKIAKSIATFLNGFIGKTNWKTVGVTLANGLNTVVDFAYTFFTTFDFAALGLAIANAINGFVETVDFAKIGQTLSAKIKGILDLFISIVENTDWYQIGESLATFIENIDFAGIVSRFAELFGAALGALASLLAGFLKDAVNGIKDYFMSYFEAAGWDKDQRGFEAAKNIIVGLYNGIIDALKNVGTWIYQHIFVPFIDGFKNAFGIHSPSTVMAEMGQYIIEGLLNGISGLIGRVGEKFNEIKELIINKLLEAKDGAVQKANEMWTGLTSVVDNIKEKFRSGFESLINIVKSPMNWIISMINGLIDRVEAAQHWIAEALSFNIDLPGWAEQLTGYSNFGISVGKVSMPRLPYLATGAVIPPNAPFMAVLGDQRKGNNIEAPEDLLRKIVREESGQNKRYGGNYQFTAQINRRTIFDEIIAEAKLRQTVSGINPFELV